MLGEEGKYTKYTGYGFLIREYASGVLVLSFSSTRYLRISKQG